MFGYVIVDQEDLKIRDYKKYRSYYCGLCKTLHQEYGRIGQCMLNYDMTFWLILMSGLYEKNENIEKKRCIMHPLTKHECNQGCFHSYASDMTIVLSYLKLKDDVLDEKNQFSNFKSMLFKKKYEQIKNKYFNKVEKMEQKLHHLHQLEASNSNDLDALSKCSGDFLKEVFVYQEDEWTQYMMELADYLGRFIYLMDAYEDLEKDKEKQVFNPWIFYEEKKDFDEWVKEILQLLMANVANAFESLPILQHYDILHNIIYQGVWINYDRVYNNRRGERNE